MKQYLAAAVAGVLIVSTGLVHAYWTGVFGSVDHSAVLQQFADRLQDVPLEVGDWSGEDLQEMDARERLVAGATAALSRRYVNRQTKQGVSVFMVTGYFRNIAQHTPDQCYVAAGFTMLNPPIQYSVETDVGKLDAYTTVFKKDESTGTQYLRVFWTWSYDGEWQAPNMPRVALVGKPALYKMYLVTETAPNQEIGQNPSIDFMLQFIPALNAALFKDSTAPGRGETPPMPGSESPVAPTSPTEPSS
ncbi:MAG: exosortase-associated EpsI family protein [Planctomycetia bacterium]|nr:exosortase-associated EpsI family protein [Planctomycetia bacterium]